MDKLDGVDYVSFDLEVIKYQKFIDFSYDILKAIKQREKLSMTRDEILNKAKLIDSKTLFKKDEKAKIALVASFLNLINQKASSLRMEIKEGRKNIFYDLDFEGFE